MSQPSGVDHTHLRVLARGNHRTGYAGVIEIIEGMRANQYACRHWHKETGEARDCVRRMVRRSLDQDLEDWFAGYH